MKVFCFYHKKDIYKTVDIVIFHPLDFTQAYQNKTIKKAKDIEIYIASIEDLILMKHFSDRKQDISDIELLKKIKTLPGA